MIKVTMACGHTIPWEDGTAAPVCDACQERRVGRVQAGAPRFRGRCEGPSATTDDLEALPISMPGADHGER